MGARDLSDLVRAYSSNKVSNGALFEELADEAVKKIATFEARDLAGTAWAYSRAAAGKHLSARTRALFCAIEKESLKKLQTFSAADVSTTAEAFALAKVRAPHLFGAFAIEAVQKMDDYDFGQLSKTARAYASANFKAALLFEAIAEAAPRRAGSFDTSVSDLVWAFAAAEVAAPALFDAMAQKSLPNLDAFSTEQLAEMMWAYASARGSRELLDALAAESLQHIAALSGRDLSRTAWAASEAGLEALFDAISKAFVANEAQTFLSEDLTLMAQALTKAKVEAPELFAALSTKSKRILPSFTSAELSRLARAFANAGVEIDFFQSLTTEALRKVEKSSEQDTETVAFSLIRAGKSAPQLEPALFDTAAARARRASADTPAISAKAERRRVRHVEIQSRRGTERQAY